MLEEGIGDHGHQGMAVKAAPGAALEVVEAQFLLHLLPVVTWVTHVTEV